MNKYEFVEKQLAMVSSICHLIGNGIIEIEKYDEELLKLSTGLSLDNLGEFSIMIEKEYIDRNVKISKQVFDEESNTYYTENSHKYISNVTNEEWKDNNLLIELQ